MKMKGDFVTNSSSTSFILTARSEVKFDVSNIILMDFKDTFNHKPQCTFERFLDIGIDNLKFKYSWHNPMDMGSDNYGEVEISLKKNAMDNTVKLSIINKSPVLSNEYMSDLVINETINIVSKFISNYNIKGTVKFPYEQHVSSYLGDGWDGGDAMGHYKESSVCIEDESRSVMIELGEGDKLNWTPLEK